MQPQVGKHVDVPCMDHSTITGFIWPQCVPVDNGIYMMLAMGIMCHQFEPACKYMMFARGAPKGGHHMANAIPGMLLCIHHIKAFGLRSCWCCMLGRSSFSILFTHRLTLNQFSSWSLSWAIGAVQDCMAIVQCT